MAMAIIVHFLRLSLGGGQGGDDLAHRGGNVGGGGAPIYKITAVTVVGSVLTNFRGGALNANGLLRLMYLDPDESNIGDLGNIWWQLSLGALGRRYLYKKLKHTDLLNMIMHFTMNLMIIIIKLTINNNQ